MSPSSRTATFDALTHEQLELLADLLADRLADRLATRLSPATGRTEALIDAHEVARITGKKRGWVYDHAGELGAVRLGSGRRPRLGFFRTHVLEHLERVADPPPQPMPKYAKPRRRPLSSRTAAGAELLDVRAPVRVKVARRERPKRPS